MAGAFAEDESGNVYVVHRGKLGGNYSKKTFDENYDGEWTTVQDGDTKTDVVVIGRLNDPELPEHVRDFVYDVYRMKNGEIDPEGEQDNLNSPKNTSFYSYLLKSGYFFDPELVENFLLSLKVKPFIILTGNSGTGKTKLAQLFAQYLSDEKSENKYIQTHVKVNHSSIQYKAWTLPRTDLKPLNLELEKDFNIKVNGIPSKGKLSMSPRLWYEDPEGKINLMLKKLSDENSEKEIKIDMLIGEDGNNGSNYCITPIGSNWTENRFIVGFYNVITKEYQKTSALNVILEAGKNPSKPYFLILDEMNLSHVERYFSDFLSAMESGEKITLHHDPNLDFPTKIDIPKNLFVIGTVNVDETTYMFSPKVLDRANTIEFSTCPAEDYMLNNHKAYNPPNTEYIEDPLSNPDIRNCRISKLKEELENVTIDGEISLWDTMASEITEFQKVLKKAGFDFGFRVIDEILRFMYVAWIYENRPETWDNWMRYFDAQIKQKMLPKLHGSQRVLEDVLRELFELCYPEAVDVPPHQLGDIQGEETLKYPSSALKIQEMSKVLYEQRYVSFIN